MTERKMLKGWYSDTEHENREEEFEWNYEEKALSAYKKAINYFNETLRPGEFPRTALKAEWVEESKSNFYCEFEKENFITKKDSRGYYDKMKCIYCGKIKKRYSLEGYELKNVACMKK
jgi:hypothetical protein